MGQRPAGLTPPEHWTNEPVPEPDLVDAMPAEQDDPLDPTRFGDWTLKGIAVDF